MSFLFPTFARSNDLDFLAVSIANQANLTLNTSLENLLLLNHVLKYKNGQIIKDSSFLCIFLASFFLIFYF